MQKTKTFKIGEYAIGGIIQVEIKGKTVIINVRDYFTKELVTTGSVFRFQENARHMVKEFLNTVTTPYYTDNILKWLDEYVEWGNEEEFLKHYFALPEMTN